MKRVAQRQARSSKIVWKIGCGEITIEPATFLPRLQERIGLSFVLVGSPVEQVLQPNVKSAELNPEKAAYRSNRISQA